MYPGYRLKVLHRITFSVLLYLHLKPTAGCQMSTSAKQIGGGGGGRSSFNIPWKIPDSKVLAHLGLTSKVLPRPFI